MTDAELDELERLRVEAEREPGGWYLNDEQRVYVSAMQKATPKLIAEVRRLRDRPCQHAHVDDLHKAIHALGDDLHLEHRRREVAEGLADAVDAVADKPVSSWSMAEHTAIRQHLAVYRQAKKARG